MKVKSRYQKLCRQKITTKFTKKFDYDITLLLLLNYAKFLLLKNNFKPKQARTIILNNLQMKLVIVKIYGKVAYIQIK